MTEGSSQGLFEIVAIVIFGIFVLISYILFRDNLKIGLSSIFEESISETIKNTTNFQKYENQMNKITPKITDLANGYHIKYNEQELEDLWYTDTQTRISFLNHKRSENIVIPWGYSIEMNMTFESNTDFTLTYDYNSSIKVSDGKFTGNDLHTNDYTGGKQTTYYEIPLKKGETKRILLGYSNNRLDRNPDMKDLYNWSTIMILKAHNSSIKDIDFKVIDISYRIFKK